MTNVPEANEELVYQARSTLARVKELRPIDFVYVKGHSGTGETTMPTNWLGGELKEGKRHNRLGG